MNQLQGTFMRSFFRRKDFFKTAFQLKVLMNCYLKAELGTKTNIGKSVIYNKNNSHIRQPTLDNQQQTKLSPTDTPDKQSKLATTDKGKAEM
jgi:hypothetical protein